MAFHEEVSSASTGEEADLDTGIAEWLALLFQLGDFAMGSVHHVNFDLCLLVQ